MSNYDVIVLGTGGAGSAALYHLAQRGLRALGLDRFPGGHDRGSSHGATRIIRQAYFEHPDYTPLLRRAYLLWKELEEIGEEQLFYPVGLIEIGPPDGVVVPGVLKSAKLHSLQVDRLTPADVAERFSGFRLPEGAQAVYEQQAGYLAVEQCVLGHLQQARQLGAEVKSGATVQGFSEQGSGVVVRTDIGEFRAQRLIVTTGAWAGDLLPGLKGRLRVLRKHLHWFAAGDEYRADRGCPTFFIEAPGGNFYGFPNIDGQGVKVAEHSRGTETDDPLGDDRSPEEDDRRRVEQFLADHLPGVSNQETNHAVCFYTMSPDEHFIVGRLPDSERIFLAAGLSGHGFKFVGVLGQALADLAADGRTDLPIDFLRYDRPGLQKTNAYRQARRPTLLINQRSSPTENFQKEFTNMPKVTVALSHSQPPSEVMEKIKPAMEKTLTDFQAKDLEMDWRESSSTFNCKSLGFTIKGTVDVNESEVVVVVELPFAAMMFKDRVEKAVNKNISRALQG